MNTPSFLQVILARFFNSFKMKNKVLYFVVAAIVATINLAVNNVFLQETYVELFGALPSWFDELLKIISVIYLAISAPHTQETVEAANIEKAIKKNRKF